MVTAVGHLATNSVLVSMEAPVARRLGNPARDRCHGTEDRRIRGHVVGRTVTLHHLHHLHHVYLDKKAAVRPIGTAR